MTDLSRRTLLVGAAATAATAVLGGARASLGVVPQQIRQDDLQAFVGLSEKLTGIAQSKLSPGVDPVGVASVYFTEASKVASFKLVLQAFKTTPTDQTVASLMKNPRAMYLCRSIILAWYLGAWYDPDTLEAEALRSANAVANKLTTAAGNKPSAKRYNLVKCRVISPTTYTQGWVWRIAQAHPMGYVNLQFGYWHEKPPKIDDFIS